MHRNAGTNLGDLVQAKRDFISKEHGARVARGMALRAERGGLPGRAPLGYKNTWANGKKTAVVDEAVAPLVAEAFRLAASGSSVRKVLAELTAKGLRTRNGKEMGAAAMARLLANPFYCGTVRLNGRDLPGSHEAIISKTLFRRVARGLMKRKR